MRGHLGTSWWALKPIVITVTLACGFFLAYLGFTRWTADGTFLREFVNSVIGALLTIGGTLIVATIAFRDQLRSRREARTLRRFDQTTWDRGALKVGAMEIPDIVVVASCRHHVEWTQGAAMTWAALDESPREGDPLVEHARNSRLPALQERAARDSLTLSDDLCVDLRSSRIELERTENSRRPVYRLRPGVARYFDFITVGAMLDDPLDTPDGRRSTLRNEWKPVFRSIEDVGTLPCVAKVGTVTAVVTKDGRIVFGVRGRTIIAGQDPTDPSGTRRIHVVGEGMTPDDLDSDGLLDPRQTSLRGIREELQIGPGSRDLGRVTDHWATGFFLDQKRVQPCFAYLSRIDLTWDELTSAAPTAQDFWEVIELRSLPFDIAHVGLRRLLLNRHPDLSFASNHAAAVVWFACLYEFGFHRMRDELSVPLPPLSQE